VRSLTSFKPGVKYKLILSAPQCQGARGQFPVGRPEGPEVTHIDALQLARYHPTRRCCNPTRSTVRLRHGLSSAAAMYVL